MLRPTLRAVFTGVLLLWSFLVRAQPTLQLNAGVFAWQMRFRQDDPHVDDLTSDPGPGHAFSLHYREEPADRRIGFDANLTYAYRECTMSIRSGGHATSDLTYADLHMGTMHLGLGLNIPVDSVGTLWFRPRLMAGLAQWTLGSGYHEFMDQGHLVRQSFSDRHFDDYRSGVRLSIGIGLKIKLDRRLFLDMEPYYSYGLTIECDPGNANFRHDEWGLRIGTGVALRGWRNLGQLPMPKD